MSAKHKRLAGAVSTLDHNSQLPDLGPEALLRLTRNIESSLKKSATTAKVPGVQTRLRQRIVKKKNDRLKQEPSTGRVQTLGNERTQVPVQQQVVPDAKLSGRRKSHLPSNKQIDSSETQSSVGGVQWRGKKRLRDGQLRNFDDDKTKGKQSWVNGQVCSDDPRKPSTLEQELLELGATGEDYELIADIASDSEIEGHGLNSIGESGKVLKKDLLQLIQNLGVHKIGPEELGDTSASEKEEDSIRPDFEDNPNSIALNHNKIRHSTTLNRKEQPGTNASLLHIEPQSAWHATILPALPISSQNLTALPHALIDCIHQHARSLLNSENERYTSRDRSSSAAHQFYSTIMSSGTLSDKISALTLSIQESPVHNMKALESLIGLARKRSRGQAVEVLGALKDLFGQGALLPSDRKLKVFAHQPGLSTVFRKINTSWKQGDLLPKPLKESHLIAWAYEHWLKTIYFEVLQIIETWCNDEIVFARAKAVDYVYELLKQKPEQEANLLRLLVNKLGDSDKKIASKTCYNILQLETTHPLMKSTIITSIESDLILRPGQSLHAKYYAIITLNQTVLSGKEEGVARKLLKIYFDMFIRLLMPLKSNSVASGVNSTALNRKGEVQGGGGSSGKKAQRKLEMQEKSTDLDEALREKMISALLTGVNRAIPFTNTDDETFEKHLDTLFKVTHSSNFNTSIQALLLIQQLNGSHQRSTDRFYRTLYESLLDPRLLTSSKQAMYLNLLFRSLRSDLKVKRVKAFSKRLLQVIAMHQAPFACGVLYLLRELEGVFNNLQVFIDQPEVDDSDEEENFRDVLEDEDQHHISPSSPSHMVENVSVKSSKASQAYHGRKRDPEYSNAEKSCLWELTPFSMHFHPSVALFASKLLTHEAMPAKPDLSLHTLIHFLDRFVYRNPKKSTSGSRGASIMQPLAGSDLRGLLISARTKHGTRAPVNTEAFWKMEGAAVDADDVFFHAYFSTMGKGKEQARNRKAGRLGKADKDSEAEENEDEIWKALVDSRPELEGSDESDSGLGTDDMESVMQDDVEDAELAIEDNSDKKHDAEAVDAEDAELDLDDDDEGLLDSEDEVPSGFDEAFGSEARFNQDNAAKVPEMERSNKKRRRLKNLPTFASVDEYAGMLDNSDDEGL